MNSESEVQKLKSKLLALKDTYQDEQAKNLSLVDLLQKNELQMKSLQNEMESLQFQNRQLTKKVTILQEDLQNVSDSSGDATKSGCTVSARSMDDFSVLDGELQSKIQENAQLHLDFEEQKVTSRQLLQRLENQLTQTRSESVARIKELQAIIQSERQKNTELIEEKNQLEVKLIEYLAEMQRHKAKETQQIVVECPSTNDVCAEAHAKMMLFVEKYMNAEKRSMSFEVECKMLENRLEFVQDSLRKAKRNNESLQTSVQNYESQLSAMSEYVASLDDKIIRQNDEIETLRQLHQLKKSNSNK